MYRAELHSSTTVTCTVTTVHMCTYMYMYMYSKLALQGVVTPICAIVTAKTGVKIF